MKPTKYAYSGIFTDDDKKVIRVLVFGFGLEPKPSDIKKAQELAQELGYIVEIARPVHIN